MHAGTSRHQVIHGFEWVHGVPSERLWSPVDWAEVERKKAIVISSFLSNDLRHINYQCAISLIASKLWKLNCDWCETREKLHVICPACLFPDQSALRLIGLYKLQPRAQFLILVAHSNSTYCSENMSRPQFGYWKIRGVSNTAPASIPRTFIAEPWSQLAQPIRLLLKYTKTDFEDVRYNIGPGNVSRLHSLFWSITCVKFFFHMQLRSTAEMSGWLWRRPSDTTSQMWGVATCSCVHAECVCSVVYREDCSDVPGRSKALLKSPETPSKKETWPPSFPGHPSSHALICMSTCAAWRGLGVCARARASDQSFHSDSFRTTVTERSN